VILHFNYEELTALRSGARVFLEREEPSRGAVLASAAERDRVEALLLRLDGDISFSTLAEVRSVEATVGVIVECLRIEMDSLVVTTHAADEEAIAAYFDFAHGFSVAHRLGEIALEMEALIEIVSGTSPTAEAVTSFQFPDSFHLRER
jgi:hypothetical protein|tara:strand:+ start:744 stop:1187 length:444 start_codon:yes stop_codon:yes gene_type:complete